jgi:hypothetical protein
LYLHHDALLFFLQFLMEEEKRRRHATEAHRRAEIERRLQPRTAADFDILYSELEAWRMQVGGQLGKGSQRWSGRLSLENSVVV